MAKKVPFSHLEGVHFTALQRAGGEMVRVDLLHHTVDNSELLQVFPPGAAVIACINK